MLSARLPFRSLKRMFSTVRASFRLLVSESNMRSPIAWAYVPLIAATLVAVIILAQGLTLRRSYQATWQLAVHSAENVLNTVAANIERNLTVIDLSLRGAEEASTLEAVSILTPEMRRMVLFDRAASARYLGALVILDREGNLIEESLSPQPRRMNFADRDYFKAQVNGHTGTYVSEPFRSRLRDNDPSIALSRRISGPVGKFEGVVACSTPHRLFSGTPRRYRPWPGKRDLHHAH